ncbi:lytic transglycosylase domain-containing protein [Candidatus Microgenomates bacterium]|nr:lytic transglycosylase domain-containing protein [Candidatus Microgenomates bacterium]
MRSLLLAFVIGTLITGVPLSYLAIRSNAKESPEVLAESTKVTPSPPPAATATPEPAPDPTPSWSPTPKPTPTPLPVPTFSSQEINGFIDRFAGQYAVDPNVLRHIAVCESGFNPAAYNIGYAGLYQFGSITWKNFRIAIGEDPEAQLRFNAEEAVQTAAYALSQGKSHIWPNCAP